MTKAESLYKMENGFTTNIINVPWCPMKLYVFSSYCTLLLLITTNMERKHKAIICLRASNNALIPITSNQMCTSE